MAWHIAGGLLGDFTSRDFHPGLCKLLRLVFFCIQQTVPERLRLLEQGKHQRQPIASFCGMVAALYGVPFRLFQGFGHSILECVEKALLRF